MWKNINLIVYFRICKSDTEINISRTNINKQGGKIIIYFFWKFVVGKVGKKCERLFQGWHKRKIGLAQQ